MEIVFNDISKYFSASIYDNILSIGKIVAKNDQYSFVKDNIHGPYSLDGNTDAEITRMVQVIGEIHPRSSLDGLLDIVVSSCLYLNENMKTGEIEVRSIHKGMGESIYSRQECPLILWNPNYEKDRYFDVIDIQGIFLNARLKDSFIGIIAESLRELELFPPLMHIRK